MDMKRKLQPNKKSLTANIPAGIVEYFGLEVGDELDFRIEGDHIKAIPVHPSCKTDVQATRHTDAIAGVGHE